MKCPECKSDPRCVAIHSSYSDLTTPGFKNLRKDAFPLVDEDKRR
jgi:hypothetical protein